MIVKGRARSGPEQLAAYLMRVGDGERATILDRDIYGDDLHNDFLLFDAIGDAGRTDKTLYHAQICPEAKYGREMTPEQWLRSAEMLAEDMGMAHHPRRVVLHDGGDKPHIHVVFQRADPETLKMWELWENFKKHEQASLRMSKEFGMEIVPGKHAKRDREKQPEFPRAETTQAEEQQAKRLGISTDELKAQITALRQQCDDAQAFKNALADAGYVLAKGDKRGFVLVDGEGEVLSLSKFVTDIKNKEYKAFMAPIDREALPSVDEAKALQERRREEAPVKAEKSPQEASKFLPSEAPSKAEEPAPAPPASKFLPKKEEPPQAAQTEADERVSKFIPPPERIVPQAPQQPHIPNPPPGWTERTIAQEFQNADPEAERRAREQQRAAELRAKFEEKELRELRKEIWQEQVSDMQQHAEANSKDYRDAEQAAKNQQAAKLEDFNIQQQEKLQAAEPVPPKGLRAIVDRLLTTDEEREKQAARQREEAELLKARQEQERRDYVTKLDQDRARELEALRARHLQEQAEREKAHNAELDRRLREKKRALELQAELEANDRAREESGWAEDFKKEQQGGVPETKLSDEFKKTDPDAQRHEREKERAASLRAELEANEQARKESGWAEDFKKEQEYPLDDAPVDPGAERHQREKKRAAELRAELEAEEREKQLNKEKEDELGEGKG